MRRLFSHVLLSLCVLMLWSCAKDKNGLTGFGKTTGYYKVGQPYKIGEDWYRPQEQPDYMEEGIASWYGDDFHGKATANGATFDRKTFTAAHRTLPLPSMVRVTNLDNNRTLIVMVNDRGPYSKGRIIDVSEKAAEALGFKNKGTAKVRVQFLKGQTKRLIASLANPPSNGEGKEALAALATLPPEAADKEESTVDAAASSAPTAPIDLASTETSASADPTVPVDLSPLPPPSVTADATPVQSTKTEIASFPKKPLAVPAAKPKPTPIAHKNLPKIEVPGLTEPKRIVAAEPIKTRTLETKGFYIQAGTYSVKANAERAEEKISLLGDVAIRPLTAEDKVFYRVRLGPLKDRKQAEMSLHKVIAMGHADALIVAE